MSNPAIHPVVLCGGSGTRLWPRSRAVMPKPFLPLVGDGTLFEATLARCPAQAGFADPIVVTGAAHLPHVEAQWPAGTGGETIVEPCARNTAAAIALAALRLPEEAIMLVCPSDHHIADAGAFQRAALTAARLAQDGWLVSFGIAATAPETGFGYLHRGEPIGDLGFKVARFVEKPDLSTAQGFLREGGYLWNSGMFLFRASRYLEELGRHAADILEASLAATRGARTDLDFIRLDAARRLDRLCRHGEDRLGCGRSARCRMERCGLLVVSSRGSRSRCIG